MGPPEAKRLYCPQCSKKFSRSDHLKRHQLRHSGLKPYSCVFCSEAFTRSDNLRDHYPNCPERRNRHIPEAARGGRRSHACDSCTAMKLGCDGNNPCKTCIQRKMDCTFSRQQSKRNVTGSSSPKPQENALSSERGSIKFLLNSGTASFIDSFHFPTSNERRNLFNHRNTDISNASNNCDVFFGSQSENGSAFSDPFETEPIDWSLFEDENLLRFLNSPFEDVQMQSDDLFASMIIDPAIGDNSPATSQSVSTEWETPTTQSSTIIHALSEKTTSLQLSAEKQSEISHQLNFLFTPSRITKFIGLYFEFWHPHCPFLHQASFNAEIAPPSLLVAVILMGAMYSQTDKEVAIAKRLLDLSEIYIYSMDELSDDFEIRQSLSSLHSSGSEFVSDGPFALQHLQAAYLTVTTQFWAGSLVSRKRVVEMRFGTVIKVARRLGLMKTQHGPDDSSNEDQWIEKESRIRLINIMTLLDCAFCFFANFPCRIAISEIKFDLPSEDHLYKPRHPFKETKFKPSRRVTVYEAFLSLFGNKNTAANLEQEKNGNPLDLNPVDMFILIHLLYVHTYSHITLFSSASRVSDISGSCTPTGQALSASDSNITLIRGALSRWRSVWIVIRSKIPSQAWADLAFFRNGYNYWLVTQLLINNKGSADILMGMEVGCEDTLKQLKGLIRDMGSDGS